MSLLFFTIILVKILAYGSCSINTFGMKRRRKKGKRKQGRKERKKNRLWKIKKMLVPRQNIKSVHKLFLN